MEIKEGLGFTELIVDTAEEFIELIRPDKTKFKQYLENFNHKYIYRGQADSNWELTARMLFSYRYIEVLSYLFNKCCNCIQRY